MENPDTSDFTGAFHLSSIQVATAGEALVDLIMQASGDFYPALGGSVFNFTRALARQGVAVAYLNPLSQDCFGQRFRTTLQEDHAVLAQPSAAAQPTSLAVVQTDTLGQASYSFYRDNVADRMATTQQLQAACTAMPKLQLVCTGCLALAPADRHIYLPWLQSQTAMGKTIAIDANLRPGVMPNQGEYRENVMHALMLADIVKVSEDDFLHLGYAGNTLQAAQTMFEQLKAHTLLLTLGAQGAWAFVRTAGTINPFFAQERKPLKIADTIGAGDCFFAGFLAAWLMQPADIDNALAHAIASASLNVQQSGCVPPTYAQIAAWLKD